MSDTNSEKSKSSAWQDWATRTTAVLAVLAALSSGRWGASNLQAILEQGKVNDTWAYYQADSIKAHGAEQMRDLAKTMKADAPPERMQALDALAKNFDKQAADKTTDKKARFTDASKYEKSRDLMVERGFWFEISFAALQLGVILATIASAAKSRGLLYTAIAFGLIGLGTLANGILFIKHAPRSWYENVSKGMAYEGDSPKDARGQ